MHLHSISWNIGCCRFILHRWCEIEQDNSSLPLVVPHDCADQVWLYSDLLAVQWFLVDLVFKWLVLLLVWQCKQKHSHGIVLPVVAVLCRWEWCWTVLSEYTIAHMLPCIQAPCPACGSSCKPKQKRSKLVCQGFMLFFPFLECCWCFTTVMLSHEDTLMMYSWMFSFKMFRLLSSVLFLLPISAVT